MAGQAMTYDWALSRKTVGGTTHVYQSPRFSTSNHRNADRVSLDTHCISLRRNDSCDAAGASTCPPGVMLSGVQRMNLSVLMAVVMSRIWPIIFVTTAISLSGCGTVCNLAGGIAHPESECKLAALFEVYSPDGPQSRARSPRRSPPRVAT